VAACSCLLLQAVVKPESTQQLAAAIKQFSDAAKQSGKPLKIRASRR
jgi:hypothetical protein